MDNKPLTPEEYKEMCEATARIRHEISDARDTAIIKDFEEYGCTDVYLEGFHFMGIPYIRIYFEVPKRSQRSRIFIEQEVSKGPCPVAILPRSV